MKTIIEVKGSTGNKYKVNLEKVTCTCIGFKYNGSRHPKDAEQRLCKHLKKFKNKLVIEKVKDKKRYPRKTIEMVVEQLKDSILNDKSLIKKYEICGSWRRGSEMIGDLDVVLIPKDWEKLSKRISEFSKEVKWEGDKKIGGMLFGLHVDFRNANKETWVSHLLYFTGSKLENIRLRQIAKKKGMKINEYGLWKMVGKKEIGRVELETEEELYKKLGEKYKAPNER